VKAKFQVGDYVYHVGAERTGRITDIFWDGYEPRYYVQHSGWVWSVPEQNLIFDAKRNQAVAEAKKAQIDS
jgi:hypothetical protein